MTPWITLLLAPLLFVSSCSRSPGNLPVVKMQIGSRTFELEVAAAEGSRTTGLMHRDSMPADHGMIFVFKQEQPLEFWMKHTRIPLDIIYVNAQGRVVAVKPMKPYDEVNMVTSDGPAKWAIELNQGEAAKAAVKVGDTLSIPPGAQDAKE